MHHSGSNGEGDEKWSDSGYTLDVETAEIPNSGAVMCGRKTRVPNDPKTFDSSHWKDEVEMRKAMGWNRFVWKIGVQFGTC